MRRFLIRGTLLALLLAPIHLTAQSFPADAAFWEVAPQVGAFAPEEPRGAEIEARPLFGARAGYRRAAGLGVEAHAQYAPLELEIAGDPPAELDLPTFLYGADVLWTWPVNPRADFSLSAGLGGITWSPDGEGAPDDSETNLRATLGATVRYLVGARIGVRGDLRDHIVFDQLADTARALRLVDRGQTNNLEISLGASFVLP